MDMRPDSVTMLLAGGVTGPLTEIAVGKLAVGLVWVRVPIALEGIAPVSCDPKVWSGVAFASDLSLTANVDASAWVTLMAVLKSTILLSPLEELLLFCWIAFRC